jgi:hypothetical protein
MIQRRKHSKGYLMHASPWAVTAVCATTFGISWNDSRANGVDARFQTIYTSEWKWREEQIPHGEDSQKPVAARRWD